MGFDDKFENKKDELAGKAKQRAGEATDDEQLEAEGRGQRAKGSLKRRARRSRTPSRTADRTLCRLGWVGSDHV